MGPSGPDGSIFSGHRDGPSNERTIEMRTLSLVKGGRCYVFRYPSGREEAIIDAISQLAEDDRTDLDWLDAATLCFQVAHHAAIGCAKAMIPATGRQSGRSAVDSDRHTGQNSGADDAREGPCSNIP